LIEVKKFKKLKSLPFYKLFMMDQKDAALRNTNGISGRGNNGKQNLPLKLQENTYTNHL